MRKKLVTAFVTVMTLSLASCGQNENTGSSQQMESGGQQVEVQQSEEMLSLDVQA